VLFLVAVGLSVGIGVLRIANLAHGSLYLLGGYVAVSVARAVGLWGAGALGGVLASIGAGFALFELLRQSWARTLFAQVLLTVGVLFVAADAFRFVWGGIPTLVAAPAWAQGAVWLGGITVPVYRLILVAFGVGIAGTLWWVVERTHWGALVRAAVDDEEMAQGLGIDVVRIKRWVFGMASGLAGLGGILGGIITGVGPGLDLEMLVSALVVVVVGGVGSVLGTYLAALLVGVLDTVLTGNWPELSIFSLFAVMVAALMLRPGGLVER
ncbi:MAG: branched-chain amino acid ABC transporter permease, partial [Armatimonadota bacterium]|nr:branched-chain amino acid ABC transporter permease [Armatimonadota bacterium]